VGLSLTCGTTKDCAGAGVLGTKPALVSTNDGGHSWTVVPLALPGPLGSLSCAPGPVCYATIDLLPSAKKGRFIPVQEFVRTTNGGRSWSVYALPGAIEVLTMACPSSRECIGAGVLRSTALTVQAVAFTVSTDGGRTWAVGRLSSPYSQGWPQSFSCASAKDCMAVSESAITSFPDQAPRCPAHFTRSAMSFSARGRERTRSRLTSARAWSLARCLRQPTGAKTGRSSRSMTRNGVATPCKAFPAAGGAGSGLPSAVRLQTAAGWSAPSLSWQRPMAGAAGPPSTSPATAPLGASVAQKSTGVSRSGSRRRVGTRWPFTTTFPPTKGDILGAGDASLRLWS
jgi:hypothetical protein